ncbi:MAG: hypothetical protein MJZ11_08040 [Lachnospiraceae bacterium]|nr:hypothetical protein [Lachnospiraceae bacterium]
MALLKDLINPIYKAFPYANREMTGFLSAVNLNGDISAASIHDEIKVPLAQAGAVQDYQTGWNIDTAAPAEGDIPYVTVKMQYRRKIDIPLDGELEAAARGKGFGMWEKIMEQRIADAFRKLTNQMEADLAAEIVKGANRAYGTVGTVPFGVAGNLDDIAQLNLILDENGCPMDDRQLVLNQVALANMRGKMSNLFKVNEAGTEAFLREGYTGNLQGMYIRSSAGLKSHVKGEGTGYLVNGAVAERDRTVNVDTGSGKVLEGDIVTFAGDANKYVVTKGVDAPGALELGKPGAMAAIADNTAMTIGASYMPSVAFQRGAVVMGCRSPYLPSVGDSARETYVAVDPFTGIPYMFAIYTGHGVAKLEISVVYGAKVINSDNVALLIQ